MDYIITTPSGKKYRISGPRELSPAELRAKAEQLEPNAFAGAKASAEAKTSPFTGAKAGAEVERKRFGTGKVLNPATQFEGDRLSGATAAHMQEKNKPGWKPKQQSVQEIIAGTDKMTADLANSPLFKLLTAFSPAQEQAR